MRRREFITLVGSIAAAGVWSLYARAQQRAPGIGFLIGGATDGFARIAAFALLARPVQ